MLLCRRTGSSHNLGWGPRLKDAWREISAVLHIRTFQIIILQVSHHPAGELLKYAVALIFGQANCEHPAGESSPCR